MHTQPLQMFTFDAKVWCGMYTGLMSRGADALTCTSACLAPPIWHLRLELYHSCDCSSRMRNLGPHESVGSGVCYHATSGMVASTGMTEDPKTHPCCVHPKTKRATQMIHGGDPTLALCTGLHWSRPGAAPVPLQHKTRSAETPPPHPPVYSVGLLIAISSLQ